MSSMQDFDRRLGDWLEDGPQTVPDWLVEQSIEEAHETSQLGTGFRWPWSGRLGPVSLGPVVPVAAGALGALAVVGAFALGLLAGPRVGSEPLPTLTPGPSQAPTPGPAQSVVRRPVAGLQAVDVLPGETPDFASLIGLAATRDAIWTVVVTGESSRLVRIDAVSGDAQAVRIFDVAAGILSPPVSDRDRVWTGSAAGLHRIDGSGVGGQLTVASPVPAAEIGVSGWGLWLARDGGTTLVQAESGDTVREIEAPAGIVTGRIIGAPTHGSLWACLDARTLARLDEVDGAVTATVGLGAGADCHGTVFAVSGVQGIGDGVIPRLSNVVVDASSSAVSARFDVGAWSDVIAIDGRLWFLEILRDRPGSPLGLIALDTVTLRPASVLTFDGALHLNATFESGYLAVAGDFLWVLADPRTGGTAVGSPQIIRIPLAELRGG